MPIVTCKNLKMLYENIVALNDVSFNIAPADYICVVGENGTGKSTLVKGILGLHPIETGEVKFDGLRRGEIGYLPQMQENRRDFPASVREVVMSGCLGHMGRGLFFTGHHKHHANEAMERLKITDLALRPFSELSGGQRQRVLLARAICATDKLLLLDEPSNGLDPVVTAELYEIIAELNRDGTAVLMVSHDVRAAVKNAKRILHLDGGVKFFGTVSEYLTTSAAKSLIGGNA